MVVTLLAGVMGCGNEAPGDEDSASAGMVPSDGDGGSDDGTGSDGTDSSDEGDGDDDEPDEKLDVGGAPEPPDDMEVCLGEEPPGERLGLFDCEPCSGSAGVGSATPRWIVARVDVPSYPYRIDAIGAVVRGSSPTTLVYFEDNGLAPPAEPVFESIEVEGGGHEHLHIATLDQPLVIEPSERLFVGVYVEDVDRTLADCGDAPEGDPQVWVRDDPPDVFPWQALLNVAPQIYAYGAPL